MTDLEYAKRNASDLVKYLQLFEMQDTNIGREQYLDFTLRCIERIQQAVDNLGYQTYVRGEVEDGKETGG